MHVTLVRDLEDLAALQDEWQSILDRCRPNYVFMTWPWLSTWWRHFGRGRELFVLVVRDKRQLVGILPLALSVHRGRLGLKVRYLHFIGYRPGKRLTDYMDIIAVRKAEVVEAAFDYLRRRQHLWDIIELWDVLQDSDTIEIVARAAGRAGLPFASDEMEKALYLRTDSDWETFYRTRMRDRREFERRVRRLQERGDLRVVAPGPSNVTEFVDTLMELYGRRWPESPASLALYRGFYRQVLQEVPPEWLKCSAMRLDGRLIAAQMSLLYGFKLYHLATAYDADFAGFSPGRIQLKHLVESCFLDEKIVACYFGRGDEPYKYEWATGELSVYRLNVSNAHTSGKIGVVLRRVPPSLRRPVIAARNAISRPPRGPA